MPRLPIRAQQDWLDEFERALNSITNTGIPNRYYEDTYELLGAYGAWKQKRDAELQERLDK